MPLSADDHFAIRNLLSRYNHSIDLGEPEQWADCFTADGEFEAQPLVRCFGRDELVAFASTVKARRTGGAGDVRHWNSNVLIEGNGDTATAAFYLMSVYTGAEAKLGITGVYRDELVKENGHWKIKRRALQFEEEPPA